MTTYSALIPAAGFGARLGEGPKAWLALDQKPIFVWVVSKFIGLVDEIVMAVPPDALAYAETVVQEHGLQVRLIEGGTTRQESIRRMVAVAHGERVVIHDVARPFATRSLLGEVIKAGMTHDATAAFLPVEVPVARIEGGTVKRYLNASQVALFQTPLAFNRLALLTLLDDAQRDGIERQSPIQLWLDAGRQVHPVPGEKNNIKLTTPEDLALAQLLTPYLSR
ncbi:IspD/TarI family cytidylyltransferase [Pigmentiphaga aceris]|nr:2-C-methyl-D-erythritol 4-phosphate cytidylyltransferase [Pigmentiphaga aceris]